MHPSCSCGEKACVHRPFRLTLFPGRQVPQRRWPTASEPPRDQQPTLPPHDPPEGLPMRFGLLHKPNRSFTDVLDFIARIIAIRQFPAPAQRQAREERAPGRPTPGHLATITGEGAPTGSFGTTPGHPTRVPAAAQDPWALHCGPHVPGHRSARPPRPRQAAASRATAAETVNNFSATFL